MRMELWAIEYQLVNAAPEYVFEWLKNNIVEKHTLGDESRDQLEKSLLSRNEKLINLGLALYGEVPTVGYSLFKSDDPIIKRAALSGRSVKPIFLDESWILNDDVIPALLEEERKNEKSETDDDGITLLHELLSNKFLPSEILEAVYEKSGHFSDVNENLWISMVAMSARNERLSTPYSSTWMDGYDEYRYNAVFSSAWRLFKEFPVNKRAAHVLSYLSDRLVADGPHDMKALDIVDRWCSNDEKDDETFSYVRTALVKIVGNYSDEFKELKKHDDLAVRKGYYANLRWVKPDDVSDGFDKDGKEFLDSAIYNDSFFTSEETRGALKQACWDAPDEHSSMDYPNYFNSRAEYLSTKHPEWFKDSWSGELPFEEIEDADERREKRLEYLNTQVAELHKALLGDKDEHQESNEFGDNSILNDLRLELQQIGEHLGKLYQKSSFSWGWLAAGAALGFILGKY
jgi:hypothetical protein